MTVPKENAQTKRTPSIGLEIQGKRVVLRYKDKIIFSHSPRRPCLEVSCRKGRFRFYNGLFKIREGRGRRRPCRYFQVLKQEPKEVLLLFSWGIQLKAKVEKGLLVLSFKDQQGMWNRLWLHLHGEPKEPVYGGGEQYSRLNLRGSRLPVWVQEPGLGRSWNLVTFLAEVTKSYGGRWHTTYYSQPTFIFSSGMFLHSESSAYTLGDFTRSAGAVLCVWEIPRRIVLGVEDSVLELLGSLTSYLGRQPPLPSWTYEGMWLGVQGGREETRAKLARAQGAGVKVCALWCQDWEGSRKTSFGNQLFWNWEYDKNLYPDLPGYVGELREKGLRFLGYINPFLALDGKLYKEAASRGYCVKNPQGEDYYVTITTFPAAMLDLTHPGCRDWIKKIIRENMIDLGMGGWMADFGEYIPADARFHDGSDACFYHNRYTVDWARINREALEESGRGEEAVFFMRSGYSGSTAYASSFWNGDQLVNWSRGQGLPSVIPGSLSLGFTGAGYVHSDLGGYTTVMHLRRSRELFLRWAEMSAFTQTMRSHEGNRPRKGWTFDKDRATLAHLARMTRVFTALKPYHISLSREYQDAGLPPLRHPWIHYPGDKKTHKITYQYLYGRDLMVAPVIQPRRRHRRVYLPRDKWVHLWSGRKFQEGWITVPAPLGQPPVFYREDSPWRELFEEIPSLGRGKD